MKKLFTLLAISLVLVTPIVSCSSDDVSAKQAEADRNDLIIPGDEDNTNIQFNQLALYVSANNVPTGTMVSFTTLLNGLNVTNEVTYYVNNLEIGGSTINSINSGTFRVQAKLEGYIDSPIINVIYTGGTNPNPNPDPTGNFILNNQSYNVTNNLLVLNGASFLPGSTTEARSNWTSIVYNNATIETATVGAFIEFTTPFELVDDEGNGNVILPNGTNEEYTGISQLLADVYEENIVGTGEIHYSNTFSLNATTNSFIGNATFNTEQRNNNTLQINYNGTYQFQDNSQNTEERHARQHSKLRTKITNLKSYKSTKPFRLK